MKISMVAFLIPIAFISANASTFAQKISLREINAPLENILTKMRVQSGYDFIYNANLIRKTKPVTVNLKNVSLDEALKACFVNQDLAYEIDDQTVIISDKTVSVPSKSKADNVDISGRVVDEDGRAVSRASVRIVNGVGNTVTDDQGRFLLLRIPDKSVIMISSIGFSPITLQISEGKVLSQIGGTNMKGQSEENEKSVLLNGTLRSALIRLAKVSSELQEVVVNKGYYSTTQKQNTGNTVTITAADIEKQPIANLLQALQGRVPGMVINQQSGVPGSNFTVQIRGQNSLLGQNAPLYIVDGIPYSSAQLNQVLAGYSGSGTDVDPGSAAGLGGLSPLNNINPADIESIEILKDADATAIYGTRGANGVVLINTKKGKAGPLMVMGNVNYSTNVPTRLVKLMNTEQFLEMRREAFRNDKVTPRADVDFDLLSWDQNKYTDWTEALVKGQSQSVNSQLSISGGTPQTRFMLSGNYNKQNPPYGGNFADNRGTVSFNINNTSLNKRFNMAFSGSYSVDFNNLPGMDQYANVKLAPNAPDLLNPDGSLIWTDNVTNPYAGLLRVYNASTKNLMVNTQLSYKILESLRVKATLGYSNTQFHEARNNPSSSMMPTDNNKVKGNSAFGDNGGDTWIFEPQAEYQKNVLGGKLNALIGATMQGNQSEGQTITAIFRTDAFLNNINAATSKTIGNTYAKYAYAAVFGRVGYSYKDKYIINLTGRRDGSSRFGPGRQVANFGAVGVAWNFIDERLIKEALPFLSFGKIRSSFGITGNELGANYKFMDTFTPVPTYSYQGYNGLRPTRLFNSDFGWESNLKLEVATELGFLNDRINLSVSWFRNRSSNQLVETPLSPATGNKAVTDNLPAIVQNTGWEFVLTTINMKRKDFQWRTSANLSMSGNKLTAFPNLAESSYADRYIIGQPVSITKLYKFAGVNPVTGLYQFLNKAGALTSSPISGTDNYIIYNALPAFFGGISNSFSYKRFSVDVFMQFQKQKGKNLLTGFTNFIGGRDNVPLVFLNRWQKIGDKGAIIQRYTQGFGTASNAQTGANNSDQGFTDASYLRVKNVSISYTLNPKWLEKAFVKSLRVYAQTQNLFTFTNYEGADPETQGMILPPSKTISAGLQLSL